MLIVFIVILNTHNMKIWDVSVLISRSPKGHSQVQSCKICTFLAKNNQYKFTQCGYRRMEFPRLGLSFYLPWTNEATSTWLDLISCCTSKFNGVVCGDKFDLH